MSPVEQGAARVPATLTRGDLLARLCGLGRKSDDEPARFANAFRRLGETAGRARAAANTPTVHEPAALERLLRTRSGNDTGSKTDA